MTAVKNKLKAVCMAIDHATKQWDSGKLISQNHPNYDKLMDSGDCDSVYSIILSFADHEDNDGTWEAAIEAALEEIYPSYF